MKSPRRPKKTSSSTRRKSSAKRTSQHKRSSKKSPLKLVSIKKSPKKDKKLVATFVKDGRTKQTHFGATGYSDFTIHKDVERRQRYIDRHQARENFNDPTTAGSLSRWVLWNKPTLQGSIRDFKQKFHL